MYKAGRVEVNTDEMNIDAPMSPFMKYFYKYTVHFFVTAFILNEHSSPSRYDRRHFGLWRFFITDFVDSNEKFTLFELLLCNNLVC